MADDASTGTGARQKWDVRCDGCGRYISEIASSVAIPSSHYSREEILLHCGACHEKHGAPVSVQQFEEVA